LIYTFYEKFPTRFFHSKKRKNVVLDSPEMEDQMIDDWLNMRTRKVKRLLKKAGRKF
jgi:hypothetical protein